MKKITKLSVGLLCLAGVVGIATTTYMSFKLNDSVKNINERVNTVNTQALKTDDKLVNLEDEVLKAVNVGKDVAQEDDVVIMESYTIKSTKQISDAYINNDSSKLSAEDKETLEMASKIIDDIIKDGMSDYEKELAVYEWLVGYTNSSSKSLKPGSAEGADGESTPHGVLKNKSAVCVGYATTFRMFMQMLGIDCKVVHSTNMVHSWDEVKLDDEWYFVDVYSDVSDAKYRNFNLNDETMSNGYSWNRDFFPAAVGVKYSYAYQNLIEVDGIYDVLKPIKELVDDPKQSSKYIAIKNYKEEDYYKLESLVQKLSSYINNMGYSGDYLEEGESGNTGSESSGYFDAKLLTIEDKVVLAVYYPRTSSDNSSSEIDDKTKEKINKELTKIFGENDWDSMMDY